MLTLEQVREDLKEIRYYYAKQKTFDAAFKSIIVNSIADKVNRYNQAMRTAPLRLFDFYISLYTQNSSQETIAYDWDLSVDHVKRINKQLYEFLRQVLKE